MKLDKYVGEILNKHDALLAESIIGENDLEGLDDSHMEDDPEDGFPADFGGDADDLGLDVECFMTIAHSPRGTQFRVSPKHDMVVPTAEYKKLVKSNHKNLAFALDQVNRHLNFFVRDYDTMKQKGHKTSEFAREDRQKIPFKLNGLENGDAVLSKQVIALDKKLRHVLTVKKAENVKSNLTANDIRPFIKANNKIIKNLK